MAPWKWRCASPPEVGECVSWGWGWRTSLGSNRAGLPGSVLAFTKLRELGQVRFSEYVSPWVKIRLLMRARSIIKGTRDKIYPYSAHSICSVNASCCYHDYCSRDCLLLWLHFLLWLNHYCYYCSQHDSSLPWGGSMERKRLVQL